MKLVRDKIPQLYPEGRYRPVRDSTERQRLLLQKLAEEVGEVMSTLTKEDLLAELADVLDVVYAHAEVHGISAREMTALRERKIAERGAFHLGWVLLGPEEQ